jgi:hypothetical protein
MLPRNAQADLFLDDTHVGVVTVQGQRNNWTFARFEANEAFGQFAILFGQWLMLMHEDGHITRAASDELRRTEHAIDALRARLRVHKTGEWHALGEINIDGAMVEWKEL